MLDMSVALVDKLRRHVYQSEFSELLGHKTTVLSYIDKRRNAETLGEESFYVNIAGGPKDGAVLRRAETLLASWGLARFGKVVPGPLLRATRVGDAQRLSHMPLNPKSTYTHLVGALRKAYDISLAMNEPDRELDLEGQEEPHFGNHSSRRYADRKATDSAEITGVTKGEIDDHFGWNQKERKKDSQLHYHGKAARLRRARVTMMI